ncbi:MAG TPA: hybrid sensor histidine kinase/response regulator [Variovorax sp.]|nr:hybrid sensor histidine kinase/response regulator [Variovorax sp.]
MSEPAAAATPADARDERIAQTQLRLVRKQLMRLPLAYLLVDLFTAGLLMRMGPAWAGPLWLAMLLPVQLWRWRYVRRAVDEPPGHTAAAMLRRLSLMIAVLGAMRGTLVPLMFSRPVQAEHYMFTMVYLGILAGTVGAVAGQVRPFLMWSIPATGTLALAWMMQGGADGLWLGALIVSLIAILTGHVRDQGQSLRDFVTLASDNERLAESLRVARDQSEAASLSKTRFFAAASHDLRQPLHALSINATTLELLARRQTDPRIRELSQSIHRALEQSNGLLDSLLDISNLDADAIRPEMADTDLAALLGSIREDFAALAAHEGLALRLDLRAQHATAWTDADLLRRVLNNLVGNALKFSTAGCVTLGLALDGTRGHRDVVEVSVSDEGPGIAADEQERIFEEFYQIGNVSRDRSKGLGLGLSIVRRTVALLGAELRLHSVPGQGTRIRLLLPPGRSEPTHAPVVDPSARDDRVEALPGLRVLVVDDEIEILRSLQALLAELGCEARCVSDGAAALAALDTGFAPDVLLVDHRLREERGSEVVERLRLRLGPVPAVMVTGDTEPSVIQLSRAAGHRVIHKPVQGHLLMRALHEVHVRATAIAAGDGGPRDG